ncbi:PKD domain-containing protein [Algoriphagus sp. D3-2-R+10]|uniref:PKD domain-containing protein n=1 Tax=Algoriphagus aurantiacus TaxID=3103948 RepID=UPI002B3C1B7B|nr:PKD domain-containing protein [Algoriphagus sp. D3-2-R+10]MEB2773758.1 PKD domain-containing protein [Algoriphagus sp. D3-2-R+10]
MQPLQSYPVFEADQVLSNGHLNNLLNYLEQQERLTRIKLLGRGIVCGLEISTSNTAISISKGCGLTSQGYLVHLCETNFTHYTEYVPPVLPNDLYFLTQCSTENRENIPYYGEKGIFELIPDNDKETENKKSLSTLNLADYAVVLFLETEQIDLKNCDTQDCNDKGSRMDFALKTLLVNKKLMSWEKWISFNSIFLKRYNVPVGDLKTSEDILQGFLTITDDQTLKSLSENLIRSWDRYAGLLGLPEENPLKELNLIDFKKKLSGNTGQRIYLQYFYDFIDDLVKAYLEFRSEVRNVFGECCPNEMDFPLHLILGMASENTSLGKRNIHRHYFEPSPIQEGQAKNKEEAASLLERLVAMVNGFSGERLSESEPIIITPNTLGAGHISHRAIPYYYDWKAVNPLWYFCKSYNGNERYNLGYQASQQIDAPEPVKNPLLYDIERYNAFRIEGHVGKNYRTALTEIIRKKQEFNLPFEVLALNAIDFSAILNGKGIQCHVEDLASDYRVMITGIVCQLQQIIAYVGNLRPKRTIEANTNLRTEAIKKDFYISKNIVDMQKIIKSDLSINKPISISNADIINKLALRDVEEGEKLADFVAKDVSSFIVSDKAFFDYIIKQPDLLLIFLQQLAEIVKYLLSFDLGQFDEEAYNKLWTPYSKTVASLIKEAASSENEEIKHYFSEGNTQLLFKCANEKLFALKDEYLKRVEQYAAAVNFNEYFKKHPGMEHKAGVPKGGTFILVYNGETQRLLTLPDLTLAALNTEFIARDTFTNLTSRATETRVADTKTSAAEAIISKPESLTRLSASKRTEFEFASDLIKNLNLGEAAKSVLDELNIRDKAIRETATPITKGTVIADFYLPYLCCSDCPPIAYVIPEVEEPENRGPIANAGEDQTITLRPDQPISITLDGSASKDEDGTIKTFAWSQLSGTPVTLKTPNKPKATAELKADGVYVFTLKVTDDKGAVGEDTVSINVVSEPENRGPQADAGRDQSLTLVPGQPISATLDGSASKDEDGTIKTFAWSQVSGSTATLKTPEKVKTAVELKEAGEYVFALKVTDDKGASSQDELTINVVAAQSNPPIAEAGDDISLTIANPNSPGRTTLDGTKSVNPDNGELTFNWTLASGPTNPSFQTPNQAKTNVTGLLEGDYKFRLEVKNSSGKSSSDSVLVKVTSAPIVEEPRTKTCGSLADILEAFAAFDKTEPTTNFKKFLETLGSYGEMKEFFTSMKTISSSNTTKQIDFFASAFGRAGLVSKLRDWLVSIQNIMLEIKEFRGFGLQLYQILTLLINYIVCIQKEDYDAAKIPMEKVFDVIEEHAKNWAELREGGEFGRVEVALIAKIEAGFTAASTQTTANGEATAKPKYLRRIKIIEGIL